MSEAKLNPAIAELDPASDLYALYDKLYNGLNSASTVDPPAVPEDVLMRDSQQHIKYDPVTGEPMLDSAKLAAITQSWKDYNEILMRNSAYMYASSIMSVLGGGGGGGGGGGAVGYRHGDSMDGLLGAVYGFEAGWNGIKIFETTFYGVNDTPWAIVTGNLTVTGDTKLEGRLNLADSGLCFNETQVIYYNNGELVIDNEDIKMEGDIDVDGSISVGLTKINNNGVFWNNQEYYHAGNSNKADVNWTMKDGTVKGNLNVTGQSTFTGKLTSTGGFLFKHLNQDLLYTGSVSNVPYIILNSDLSIVNSHGVKLEDTYIIKTRSGSNAVVSFAAPGMIMNLGDTIDNVATNKITLQADLYDYTGAVKLVSRTGEGYFPQSLKAGKNNSIVLDTYQASNVDLGVLFQHYIRFGNQLGPALYQDNDSLYLAMKYTRATATVNDTGNVYFATTTSPFHNLSLGDTGTLHFNTTGEFFAFDKPSEAEYFAIKSEQYKTRLIENTLFFDDGKFIEGVTDGLRYAGNAYFDNNLFNSSSFTPGFAGSGWAIMTDSQAGGLHATFDTLTIRKKMRVYELETQRLSVTNGSLWVSDSCSGDEVRVVV